MELVRRLWNGRWGRLARADIWVKHDETWIVEWRKGDGDAPVRARRFATRDLALAWADRLMRSGGDGWKDITDISRGGASTVD